MTWARRSQCGLAALIILEGATHMADYQPLILALASFVGALTTAVPTYLLLISHGASLGRVETSTNGSLSEMRAEVARLNAALLSKTASATQEART